MQIDRIEKISGHTVQHGCLNNRIYLMEFCHENSAGLPAKLIAMAKEKNYTKIFAKIPESHCNEFLCEGFEIEATIPGFYNGRSSACFLGYYLNCKRGKSATENENANVMNVCDSKLIEMPAELPVSMSLRKCITNDAYDMAEIYRQVFSSYPFPVYDPGYIVETMNSNVDYFGVWQDETLIALSSAEKSEEFRNAEMTDFATLPSARGFSLSGILLNYMEKSLMMQDYQTAYTIARARSFGMNVTFAKQGYTFGGRLIQNTQICGSLEDMNVWYKKI